MKKSTRALAGIALAASFIVCSALAAAPASAVALLGTAGNVLSMAPGIETLTLGLIGLGCLGLARHRASS